MQTYQNNPTNGSYPSVHIGPALKRWREQIGITQAELAGRLCRDESATSRWECTEATRYRPVPGPLLPALAAIFGTTVAELAGDALNSIGYTPKDDVDDEEEMEESADIQPITNFAGEMGGTRPIMAREPFSYSTSTGSDLVPRPVPGRPTGEWRVRCWKCGHRNTIAPDQPAPRCNNVSLDQNGVAFCGAPLRASVRVQVLEHSATT